MLIKSSFFPAVVVESWTTAHPPLIAVAVFVFESYVYTRYTLLPQRPVRRLSVST